MSVKIIIDTDAKNEIDDQYAITYAVLSKELDVLGFTASHYAKNRSMEKSYDEIIHVLKLLGKEKRYPVFRGAETALRDKKTPADSPAAMFMIEEAQKITEGPLWIVSIGAITNLASAYLIHPGIKDRVKLIWLAGKRWPRGGFTFNDKNDILAAQIIFGSDIDFTLVPVCRPASKLKIYCRDKARIKGKGAIGDYLWRLFIMRRFGFPKPVYDVAAVAAVKSRDLYTAETAPRPAFLDNGKYDHSMTVGEIKVVTGINVEKIRADFFALLDGSIRK
ncbi:MAG: nucleoside hydrolase [Nitrospirota bacterium]